MAGTTGLEPATSDVTGRRSNQLSYVPLLADVLRNGSTQSLDSAIVNTATRPSNFRPDCSCKPKPPGFLFAPLHNPLPSCRARRSGCSARRRPGTCLFYSRSRAIRPPTNPLPALAMPPRRKRQRHFPHIVNPAGDQFAPVSEGCWPSLARAWPAGPTI